MARKMLINNAWREQDESKREIQVRNATFAAAHTVRTAKRDYVSLYKKVSLGCGKFRLHYGFESV